MFKRIDESQFLIAMLKKLSDFLARQRALPSVIGIAFVAASAILEIINLGLNSTFLQVFQIFFHYVGIITALIGLLVIQPLGD
ncbi:MAG: hypothetical protein Q9P01_05230 [Anaerolineae bacterium]|nr:hypothetical protein [Anaerolineae bacterium]